MASSFVTATNCITFIETDYMNKETYRFMYPTGITSFAFSFSDHALQWLCGTTTDDSDRETGNFVLFNDLLARMALTAGEDRSFRRPLMLSAGQAQYSEEQLSTQWNMGRKRIRNLLAMLTDMGLIDTCRSRVASVMTFPCLLQWGTVNDGIVPNPFACTNKGKEYRQKNRQWAGFQLFVVLQSGSHPSTVCYLNG